MLKAANLGKAGWLVVRRSAATSTSTALFHLCHERQDCGKLVLKAEKQFVRAHGPGILALYAELLMSAHGDGLG